MGAGAIFEGLISGLNEGIGSVRQQNQRDAEIEMKTEQEILTTLAKTSENAQVRDDALEALLNLGQSGKPTGFIKTLLKQRGKNPDIARLISSARQAGVDPITGKQDMKAPVDTGGPPAAAPAPVEAAPPIAFDQAPPMGGGELPMPPAVAPLPSAPQGPAAQPINTTQHRTPISFSAGAQAPTHTSTAPASFPPPPAASMPPAPTASRFGVMSPLEGVRADASAQIQGQVAAWKAAGMSDEQIKERLSGVRPSTSASAVGFRELADLAEKEATTGLNEADKARQKLLREAHKLDPSARDKSADAARLEAKKAGLSLHIRAANAKAAGDTATYQHILEVQKALGLAGRAPKKEKTAESSAKTKSMVQVIMDNPSVYEGLTPTSREDLIPDLAAAGFKGFGKSLSNKAVEDIAITKQAVAQLADLRNVLQENEEFIGPISGLQALNPWSEAKQAQATINLVKQRVGKALEGGVLRKEDELKYKEILAKLTDTPETAFYKVDGLIEALERDIEIYLTTQAAAGRNIRGQREGGKVSDTPPPATSDDAAIAEYKRKKGIQ